MKVTLTREQLEKSKKRYLEALKLLCALPGAPTVYYGDEVGMEGMSDPWNRAPMVWEGGDEAHRKAVSALLAERKRRPMLQTGFLDVEALDANCLRIRRFAVEGKDVFGEALEGKDVFVKITRR